MYSGAASGGEDGVVTIVVADDHPLFRKGLRDVVAGDAALRVVAEAGDGEAALRAIEHFRPRIAILDVDMPKMNGLDVARALQASASDVGVILLTMYDGADIFHRALELGVMGYVLKESADTDILACIHMVVAGRPYLSPAMSHHLLGSRVPSQATRDAAADPLAALTRAEREVLRLIARNLATKEIAQQLGISPKTVENHRSHICVKLDLHGTHALVRFALTHPALLS